MRNARTGAALVQLVSAAPAETVAAYGELLDLPVQTPTDRFAVANGAVQITPPADGRHHRLLFGGADDADTLEQLRRRGLAMEPDDRGGWSSAAQPAVGLTDDVGERSRFPQHDPHGDEPRTRDIVAIDHVVCGATSRDTAAALFGAVLGLDFRLDQQIFDGMHQLFFRTGHFVVEVIVGHRDHPPELPVSLWGLAWRAPDLAATRERLLTTGVTVGEITTGRKRGTEVCTVKDPRLVVPTILIGPAIHPAAPAPRS